MFSSYRSLMSLSLIQSDYIYIYIYTSFHLTAQSTGAVEYTDCILAKGKDSLNVCLSYDTKQSDGEASVMFEL